VRNSRLEQLAERIAALEDAVAGGRSSDLDTRLLAIETALHRLSHGDRDLDQLGDLVRRSSELLERHVPGTEGVLVAWRGDPAMLSFRGRSVVPFPRPRDAFAEGDFGQGASAIAQLEAQRAQGIRFLLIPEQAHVWLAELPEFKEHLFRAYELLADEEGAGLLFDVGSPRDQRSADTLVEVLDRILDGERYAPILDWTGFALNSLMSERGIFAAPPESDGELPYLDSSIDVVVVDDPTHFDEGSRVATSAVVLVEPDQAGDVGVARVEEMASERSSGAEATVMVAGAEADDPWLARVAEAIADPRIAVVPGSNGLGRAGEDDSAVVAIVERGVLPLPGCIEVAAATLQHNEGVGAVAVKLLDSDGVLEGAGATVFADGSAEGIGAGSAEVSAPWHEYAHPVCAATGLLVGRSSALRETADGTASLIDLSGRLQADGHRVLYQPDAWAVRALETGFEEAPDLGEAWQEVLPSRPARPERLNTSAWRWLLAHDEVEESWR
jgi:hypothetical protein